jgi:hypothetical protein
MTPTSHHNLTVFAAVHRAMATLIRSEQLEPATTARVLGILWRDLSGDVELPYQLHVLHRSYARSGLPPYELASEFDRIADETEEDIRAGGIQ